MESDFKGKTFLVTGGNSGIGLAAAKALVSSGANVAITGRSQEKLDAALLHLGEAAMGSPVEMNSVGEIQAFVDKVSSRYGEIDGVVACAGGATVRPFEDTDEALFDAEMGRNLKGAYFSTKACLSSMRDGGTIVLLGSAAGSKGFPGMSVYGPAKAALRDLVRVLAVELAPRGIRSNIVTPGPIPTPGMDRMGLPEEQLEVAKEGFASMVPLGRMGSVENVVQAILFLSSPRSAYVTGSELAVDGGMAQV